jgi:hypothetical protein
MARNIHISESFYDFATSVRPEEVKQVQKCIRLIKEDPSNPSLRRHKLLRIRSKDLVSYSPNSDIRIIAIEPNNEDSYLLYAGHHDDAYTWAENRKISHDGLSKVIRVVPVESSEITREDRQGAKTSETNDSLKDLIALLPERVRGKAYFFDAKSDAELTASDVPAPYISLLRKIADETDLMFVLDHLPGSVGESLFALAGLIGSQTVAKDSGLGDVSTDPGKADIVENVVRYRTFTTDKSLQEWIDDLEKALQKPFEEWQYFLHPAQRKAVQTRSRGALRVTGAAGTGKTLVGIHRAKHLSDTEMRQVHFLTYNRSLMNNLLGLGKRVFGGDLGRKVQINTLHGYVAQRLESIANKRIKQVDLRTFLEPAFAEIEPSALGDGWDTSTQNLIYRDIVHVIAAQQIRSIDKYVRASRRGLERPLSLRQKEELWRIYEIAWTYANEKCLIPFELTTHYALQQNLPPLSQEALIVDEVQDLQGVDLAFLAQQAPGPNQLTLLEDTKQRIYGVGYSLKSLGINISGRRSVKLFVNYRTTAEIGEVASHSLRDLGLMASDWPRPLRNGKKPEIKRFETSKVEQAWIIERLYECEKRGMQRIAVLGRTRRTLELFEKALDQEGIEYATLDRNQSLTERGVISLCTMHSSKGLEFEVVFVIGIDYGPPGIRAPQEIQDDQILVRDFERREKQLLYVALSRARDELYISGTGEGVDYLSDEILGGKKSG